MLIVVLIAFVIALTLIQPGVVEHLADPSWWLTPALATTYVYVAALLAWYSTRLALRGMADGDAPPSPPPSPRRQKLLSALEQFWLLGGLALLVHGGYGKWALFHVRIAGLPLDSLPLMGQLLTLAPFVTVLLVIWTIDYRLHRAIRLQVARRELQAGRPASPPWTLREYLAYNLRHHLLFVAAPVLLILLGRDVLALYVHPVLAAGPLKTYADLLVLAAVMLLAGGVFVTAPLMLVRIWRTESMAPTPLRGDLDAAMARLGLRCRDILIWKSGSSIANAGVMGLLAPFRYVLLSDMLLENIQPREVKAIFAHEAGHIVHHHILYAALFAFASVGLCGAGGELVLRLTDAPPWAAEVVTLALLVGAWWLGFGFISRRFERQSDVIGAWMASHDLSVPAGQDQVTPEGALTFAQALERVAALNGIARSQWNWRHGSIAGRVEYILELARQGGSRHEIDRVVRRIKQTLWLLLTTAAAAVTWQIWTAAPAAMGMAL